MALQGPEIDVQIEVVQLAEEEARISDSSRVISLVKTNSLEINGQHPVIRQRYLEIVDASGMHRREDPDLGQLKISIRRQQHPLRIDSRLRLKVELGITTARAGIRIQANLCILSIQIGLEQQNLSSTQALILICQVRQKGLSSGMDHYQHVVDHMVRHQS